VQWPDYLTYSEEYRYRLCADISITALKEARTRLADKGLFVVADIANLPFKPEAFDGVVSMHTIHHLPLSEHKRAYLELNRVLKTGKSAVVVNGWHNPLLMRMAEPFIGLARLLNGRSAKKKKNWNAEEDQAGTFVEKMTPRWLKNELNGALKFEILPWRSLSPRFMRWSCVRNLRESVSAFDLLARGAFSPFLWRERTISVDCHQEINDAKNHRPTISQDGPVPRCIQPRCACGDPSTL
jgi:hypothetical protein